MFLLLLVRPLQNNYFFRRIKLEERRYEISRTRRDEKTKDKKKNNSVNFLGEFIFAIFCHIF